MLISRSKVVAYTLFILTVLSSFVLADPHGACLDDVKKFCSNAPAGGIGSCLKAHENELSQACRQEGMQMKEKLEEVKQACSGDAAKFCKNVTPGRSSKYHCLKAHLGELSPACQKEFGVTQSSAPQPRLPNDN